MLNFGWMSIFNPIQIILIFVSTIFSATVAAFALLISRNASFWVAKNIWAKSICFISRCTIKAIGKETFKDYKEPLIFCANHLSSFDIVALYAIVDRPIYFIAKKELKNVPFLGWYMNAAGMIFVDRSNREKAIKSMKEAGEAINQGRNIITFPEGTRSKDGNIGAFKKGTFHIASQSSIPILPIAIKGSNIVNPNNTFILKKGEITVSFGRVIENVQQFKSVNQLTNYTKEKIEELYHSI